MSKTDSFILELPLKTSPKQERVLLKRFEAARQVYNACLGEAMKRVRLLKQSRAYRQALKLPKGKAGKTAMPLQREQHRARIDAFYHAREIIGFRKYDLMNWATRFTHSWLRDHIASQEVKALVRRAFGATERWLYGTDKQCKKGKCTKKKKNCTVCGKPKFKRYGEIHSVENITNLQGLRWRASGQYVQWRDLKICAMIDPFNPVQIHGLSQPVKYIRIVRRVIKGRNRFYVQLVLAGKPMQRTPINEGAEVGLDLGPSTIAIVSEGKALLREFCIQVDDASKEIRCLQRKLDRQRRANNPDCYDVMGSAIKGKHPKNKSKRMIKTEVVLQETQRRQAEHRKSLQGQLVNLILSLGNVIKTEKLSYRAWQKQWGKSIGKHAPGMFMQMLRRKAKNTGGAVVEFSAYQNRLSQFDHVTGEVKKKPLSQRWHYFEDGTKIQRDLYSAFLALCVDADSNILDADRANELWSSVGPLLLAAFQEAIQFAKSQGHTPACFGTSQS